MRKKWWKMGKWQRINGFDGPLDAEDARESLPDDNGTARVVTSLRWYDYPLLALGSVFVYAFWIVVTVACSPLFAFLYTKDVMFDLRQDARRRNYEKRG